MSKVEVLRADQLTKIVGLETVAGRTLPDCVIATETADALLAALLEDAGAVKLTFEKGAAAHTGKMGGGVFLEAGTYHVLPIREEGRK